MIELVWLPLTLKTTEVPAKPVSLWTLVHEYVKGPVKLRIQATGTWEYAPGKSCGPDGSRTGGFLSDGLIASAPVGALIAKVGGSPADKPDTRIVGFVVGSYTVFTVDDKTEGPLYFTMNDTPNQFDNHDKTITIAIQQAR